MDALDGEFASVAHAIGRAEFAFWLGSGISRSVVPPVSALLRKMVVHLQERIDSNSSECPFRVALREVLNVGDILDEEVAAIDLEQPVAGWQGADTLVERMVGSYSKILEVPVLGVAQADYLLWEAIEVAHTYGDSVWGSGTLSRLVRQRFRIR